MKSLVSIFPRQTYPFKPCQSHSGAVWRYSSCASCVGSSEHLRCLNRCLSRGSSWINSQITRAEVLPSGDYMRNISTLNISTLCSGRGSLIRSSSRALLCWDTAAHSTSAKRRWMMRSTCHFPKYAAKRTIRSPFGAKVTRLLNSLTY
jgi:hypothetical protein